MSLADGSGAVELEELSATQSDMSPLRRSLHLSGSAKYRNLSKSSEIALHHSGSGAPEASGSVQGSNGVSLRDSAQQLAVKLKEQTLSTQERALLTHILKDIVSAEEQRERLENRHVVTLFGDGDCAEAPAQVIESDNAKTRILEFSAMVQCGGVDAAREILRMIDSDELDCELLLRYNVFWPFLSRAVVERGTDESEYLLVLVERVLRNEKAAAVVRGQFAAGGDRIGAIAEGVRELQGSGTLMAFSMFRATESVVIAESAVIGAADELTRLADQLRSDVISRRNSNMFVQHITAAPAPWPHEKQRALVAMALASSADVRARLTRSVARLHWAAMLLALCRSQGAHYKAARTAALEAVGKHAQSELRKAWRSGVNKATLSSLEHAFERDAL